MATERIPRIGLPSDYYDRFGIKSIQSPQPNDPGFLDIFPSKTINPLAPGLRMQPPSNEAMMRGDRVRVAASDKAIIDTLIAEAVGEGDEGLAAVAWTILNRANEQGKTPQQVVNSGAYTGKKSPGSAAKRAQSDPKVRAKVEQIWNSVSTGKIPDPTGGATHYWAPQGMPGRKAPYWADEEASAAGRLKIGNHVFLPKTTPNSALAAIEQASPLALPSRRPDSSLAFAPQGRTGSFSTQTAYAPGAAKGATQSLTASPIRVAGGVQGIAGARRDASGSATVRPPAISGLTSRSVKTIPIAPGNTRVPTTNLEQLQLATERYAQDYVPTQERLAQAISAPVRVAGPTTPPRTPVTVSGPTQAQLQAIRNVDYPPSVLAGGPRLIPQAPSNAPGQTWGVGGANQAGTTRMGASEPSIMPAMREQMAAAVAAQNAKPSVRVTATPIAGAQKAASGAVTYKAPTTGPTQAQLEAIRRVPAPISVSGSAVGIPGAGKAASGWISATGAPRDLGAPQYGTPGMGGGTLGTSGLSANAFVEKKYNDRLTTPATTAINGAVKKDPLSITVAGGRAITGPMLPLPADAGARARANALIAANPIPRTLPIAPRMAPVPLPRPPIQVDRNGQAIRVLPPNQALWGQPQAQRGGGLLAMLFGGAAPVAPVARSAVPQAPAPVSAGYITTPYEQSWAQTTENALMPSAGGERRRTGY